MMRFLALLVLLAVAAPVAAQTNANLRQLFFVAPSYERDEHYEIDFVDAAGNVVHTLTTRTKPPLNAKGEVGPIRIDLRPIAAGVYHVVVRAVTGTQRSADSEPSQSWTRK